MKIFLQPILLLFLLTMLVCKAPTQKQKLDYCLMLKKDQYRSNENITDKETKAKVEEIRKKYFLENYNTIMDHCLQGGFANTLLFDTVSCRKETLDLTMIHVAITYPDEFYGEANVQRILTFLNEGRLSTQSILHGVRFHFYYYQPCIKYKEKINKAIKAWRIEQLLDVDMKFSYCEEK